MLFDDFDEFYRSLSLGKYDILFVCLKTYEFLNFV